METVTLDSPIATGVALASAVVVQIPLASPIVDAITLAGAVALQVTLSSPLELEES